MLTADLAMSWRRGGRVRPYYVEPDNALYRQTALDLIRIFEEHEGRARAALDEALDEYVGVGTDYKILRGFIKLLADRCAFETAQAIDPVLIRRALFLAARAHHPLIEDEATRMLLVEETAKQVGCTQEVVREGLYADLPENQRLVQFETLGAAELLDRYNLAQAQALLYRCVQMTLRIEAQDAASSRELFGAIKAYRLIHTIAGSAAAGYTIRLDGPVSMFHRSQKYGVQMAVFLPALLMCSDWRMRAEIVSKLGGNDFFELDSKQTKLRSHYFSETPYQNPLKEKLAARWEKFESLWTLAESREVIALGENAFIPDFVFRRADGKQAYMEILGFWTPQHLKTRLQEFARSGLENFIIVATEDLRGSRDAPTRLPPNVILCKSALDPAIVELTLERF